VKLPFPSAITCAAEFRPHIFPCRRKIRPRLRRFDEDVALIGSPTGGAQDARDEQGEEPSHPAQKSNFFAVVWMVPVIV